MEAVLVSSFNGFGHFRRIFSYSKVLLSRGYRVHIVASAQQVARQRLDRERVSRHHLTFHSFERPLGLDGPQWGAPSSQKVARPTEALLSALQRANLVISDNSLWPASFSNRIILTGQFLWPDYWRAKGVRVEAHIDSLPVAWFQNPQFGDQSSFLNVSQQAIGLPADANLRTERGIGERKEIWFSSGTTGLAHGLTGLEGINSSLLQRESWEMKTAGYLPTAVVGRPGLGTITDCVAAEVPFLPTWVADDPELLRNASVWWKLLGLEPILDPERLALKEIMEIAEKMRSLLPRLREILVESPESIVDRFEQLLTMKPGVGID